MDRELPLVSIIVPIYNAELYIEQCLRSIFAQTYQNLEYIFVNDYSRDNSMEILYKVMKEFPLKKSRIQIIDHTQNLGSAVSREDGINSAHGTYTIQFDSDDYVEPDIIEQLVRTAITDNADIVVCDMYNSFPDKNIIQKRDIQTNPTKFIYTLFTGETHASLCNKLIKRELYTTNDIHFTPGFDICEDLSVLYKLAYYSKKISYIPKPLYYYRIGIGGTQTSLPYSAKRHRNMLELLRQVSLFIKKEGIKEGKIIEGFKYLISANRGMALLYSEMSEMNLFKEPEMQITLKTVFSHPCMHINHKIIVAMDLIKLKPMVYIIRKLYQLKHKKQK